MSDDTLKERRAGAVHRGVVAQPMSYESLEERVAAWAQQQPDVRALLVVGSRGRPVRPADRWSDLDLLMLTTSPARYLADPQWPKALGDLWLAARSHTLPGDPEWEVVFAGGLKADIVAVHAPEGAPLGELLARIPYQGVLGRGVRVLFTQRGEVLEGAWPVHESPALPTDEAFQNLVADFLITALRTATMLWRGELWRARYQGDAELKTILLQFLTWHTWLTRGLTEDTWYNGRFVEAWGDPQAVALFPHIAGGYAAAEQWRALHATLALFRWLTQECAARLGYRAPLEATDHLVGHVDTLFAEWRTLTVV